MKWIRMSYYIGTSLAYLHCVPERVTFPIEKQEKHDHLAGCQDTCVNSLGFLR